MSTTFNITPPPELGDVIARLKDRAGLTRALARTLDQQNLLTVARIQLNYMSFPKSGPATLEGTRVQTNRLKNSVRASKTLVTGTGLTSSIGSNVVYAAFQEYGFTGTETVSAHTRTIGKGKHAVTSAIKSYTRHVDQPGRAMFRKGIQDRLPDYSQALLQTTLNFEKGNN